MDTSECDDCEGCGKVCETRDGKKPWSHLVGSDDTATSTEVDGRIVYPKTCGGCNGIGRSRPKPVEADL